MTIRFLPSPWWTDPDLAMRLQSALLGFISGVLFVGFCVLVNS